MTVSPAAYPQGSAGTPVFVSLSNTGGGVATNVSTVTVTLNTGFTYVGVTTGPAPTSEFVGQTLTWVGLGDIAAGTTPITFQVTVTSSLTTTAGTQQFGTFNATFGDFFGEGFTSNVCRAITVSAVAGPTLTKTPSTQGPVSVGSPVTWTLTYGNGGSASLLNTVVQDTLPLGYTYSSSSSSASITPTVMPGSPAIVRWTVGTLAGGASGTLTLTAIAGPITSGTGNPLTQTFTNNATIAGTDAGGNSYNVAASAQVTEQQTDLSLGKSVDQSQLTSLPGTLTYTLQPRYSGTTLQTLSRVLDPQPAGVTFTTANQGGTVAAYVPVLAVQGLDNSSEPKTSIDLTTSVSAIATGGTVTATMTVKSLDSSSVISAVTPTSPLVFN